MDLQLGYFQTAKGFHGVRFPGRNKPAQATKTKKMKTKQQKADRAATVAIFIVLAAFVGSITMVFMFGHVIL